MVHEAPAVPLTNTVRIDAQLARDAVGRLRPAATELFGPAPGRTAEVLSVIDELEATVASAPRVPLTEVLRIAPAGVHDRLGRLRELVARVRIESAPPPPPERRVPAGRSLACRRTRDGLGGARAERGGSAP